MIDPTPLRALAATWRKLAGAYRRHGQFDAADANVLCADDLDRALAAQGWQDIAAEFYLCGGCSSSVVPVVSSSVLDSGTTWTCPECGAKTVVELRDASGLLDLP